MSKESSAWLNNNTLIGFTEKRGNAWHYRASDQGTEPNHYVGPVPVDDVRRRLFAWEAQEVELFHQVPCELDNLFGVAGMDDEGRPYQIRPIPGRKAIRRSDTYDILGVFKDGYQPHQYAEWLVQNVSNLIDDDLGIGSAGLLRGGAQAWVSVEVPENITTPEGVTFRPNLVACTSFDGSLATTYKRTVTNVVCDNTLAAGLGEKGQTTKVKHSKYSHFKIESARDALAIVHTMADDFAAEVASLCSQEVTPGQWEQIVAKLVPMPETEGRGRTMATDKRSRIESLWAHDARVAPWAGTAFGVLQAFNTYDHHIATVRGAGRAERNMSNALTGSTEKSDIETLQAVNLVLA